MWSPSLSHSAANGSPRSVKLGISTGITRSAKAVWPRCVKTLPQIRALSCQGKLSNIHLHFEDCLLTGCEKRQGNLVYLPSCKHWSTTWRAIGLPSTRIRGAEPPDSNRSLPPCSHNSCSPRVRKPSFDCHSCSASFHKAERARSATRRAGPSLTIVMNQLNFDYLRRGARSNRVLSGIVCASLSGRASNKDFDITNGRSHRGAWIAPKWSSYSRECRGRASHRNRVRAGTGGPRLQERRTCQTGPGVQVGLPACERGRQSHTRILCSHRRGSNANGLRVRLASRDSTLLGHSAKSEDHDCGEDTENDNNDQEFNQSEATLNLPGGSLSPDSLVRRNHLATPLVSGWYTDAQNFPLVGPTTALCLMNSFESIASKAMKLLEPPLTHASLIDELHAHSFAVPFGFSRKTLRGACEDPTSCP